MRGKGGGGWCECGCGVMWKWVRVAAYGSDVESNMEWVWNTLSRCDGGFKGSYSSAGR